MESPRNPEVSEGDLEGLVSIMAGLKLATFGPERATELLSEARAMLAEATTLDAFPVAPEVEPW